MLELRNVSKHFGGVVALDNVELQLQQGRVLSLIGPNGAGKTTLFNVISSFIKPDRGSVWFDGKRIDRMGPHQTARLGVGRTFQVTKVFPKLTGAENLWVSCPSKQGRDEVAELLQIRHLMDTVAEEIPLWDQKRLELAMALSLRPRLLLLDELTTGLDPEEKEDLQHLVRRIKVELACSVMLIEHDVKVAFDLGDEVAVLYYGRVLAKGSPTEIVANKDVAELYLGRMAV